MKQDYEHLKSTVMAGVFSLGQEIDVVLYDETDLGYKVAINNEYSGLVYKNEVFCDVRFGQPMKGYVKCLREDGKVDVSLQPDEGKHVIATGEKILKMLDRAGGKLSYGDKSSPEAIVKVFQVSKKVFKKAIGVLYKQKKIRIAAEGIELVR
jgi:uncharacterized protein